MALKFFDGFDQIALAQLDRKWPSSSVGDCSLTSGRVFTPTPSGQSLVVQGAVTLRSPVLGTNATKVVGFAFQNVNLTGTTTLLEFRDGTTAQCDLRFTPEDVLSVTRAGTVLGTGTRVLLPDTWYYIEVKVLIDNTGGTVEVKVNETTDFSLTSQDTQTTSNAYANYIAFRAVSSTASYRIDDVYVLDASGSLNTTFLGDMKVEAIVPGSEGTTTAWTPSSSTIGNYEAVASANSQYIQTGTTNAKDTYWFNNLRTVTSSIAGVAVNVLGRNTDSTNHTVTSVVRSADTDTDHGTPQQFTDTAWQLKQFIHEQDPNAGDPQAWTAAAVNAAEFGIKKTA